MSRFYLRLALLPLALFTAVLLLIHAQPYDDYELRQLLLPDGCPAPCFMGIRPGITTMDEAVKILEANSWVGQIKKESNAYDNTINWTWNNRIPKQVIPKGGGRIQAAPNSKRPLVDTITISSFLQLGEAYVVLGLPDTEKLNFGGYSIGEEFAYIDYMALYNELPRSKLRGI